MSDQSNLPVLRQYGKIKEVTIKKGINIDTHKKQFEYYYISFVEIVEKEEEQRILFKKKKVIVSEEVKQIVPFSFKSLEDAKDFAQYLPGMSLKGFRFYKDFNNVKFNISYETYKILIENIDTPIYIKFTKVTEHPRIYSKRKNGEITQYYGNDLDISYEPSGKFLQYNDIIVDYFFTDVAWDTDNKCIIPNMEYKTISDIKNFENENTHKFVLIAQ